MLSVLLENKLLDENILPDLVSVWSRSTKLLDAGPGYYVEGRLSADM